jgi:hypothetical protein
MGGLMNSTTQNSNQNQAQNSATNTNSGTNYGSNTASATGQNTANTSNTVSASGPSAAGQALINAGTGTQNTLGNISAFMSPYTQSVYNAQVGLENQQNQVQQQQLTGNAISQGALGGDRAQAASALLAGQQNLANNATNTGILQSGYNQALQAAQTQAGQNLQGAGLAGTQASTGTQQLGSTAGQQASTTLGDTSTGQSSATAGTGTSSGSSTTSTNPGLLTLGGLAGGLLSDERTKENIEPIGKTFDGQTIHKFNYVGNPTTHIGLIAQEVQKHHPDAVHSIGGIKMVNYDDATKGAADRGHFATGGAVQGFDTGGAASGLVPVSYNGQTYYVPQSSLGNSSGSSGLSPSGAYTLGSQLGGVLGTNSGGTAASPASSTASALGSLGGGGTGGMSPGDAYKFGQQMNGLGSQAANYLNKELFGSSPTAGAGGWQTSTQPTAGLGSNLASAAGSGLSGLGSALGLATGGSASSGVSAPSIGNLPSSAFYTPASFVPVQATAPSVSAPSVSMPSIGTPSVAQAQMPTVDFPSVPQASSGKGSFFAGGGAVKRRGDGGPVALTGNEPLSDYDRYVRNPQGYSAAMAAPATTAPAPQSSIADISPISTAATQPAPVAAQPVPVSTDTATAPVSLGAGFAAPAGQAPASIGSLPSAIPAGMTAGMNAPAVNATAGGFGMLPGAASSIQKAATSSQIPQSYYDNLRASESGGDPNAKAKTSSAYGPYQFTTGTWRSVIAKHPELGLNPEDRLRPEAQELAIKAFTADNATALHQSGVDPANPANLALAHVFGASGAAQFLGVMNKDPNAPAISAASPDAVAANHDLFYNRDGSQKTVSEVYANYNGKFSGDKTASAQPSTIGNLYSQLSHAFQGNSGSDASKAPYLLEKLTGMQMPESVHSIGDYLAAKSPFLMAAGSGNPTWMTSQQDIALRQKEQAIQQAKMMYEAMMPKQVGQHVIYDSYGQPHVAPEYAVASPEARQAMVSGDLSKVAQGGYTPVNMGQGAGAPQAAGTTSGPADMDTIPSTVTGDDFATQAKKIGYAPQMVDIAKHVADYKYDPTKLMTMKDQQRAAVVRMAQRINPDYDMTKYPAVADTEKKLAGGDVALALRSIGRLFDETSQASDLADATHNTKYETTNWASAGVYPSGSEYVQAHAKLSTALNNVYDTASAVAKGGGQGAEGDAKRRAGSMNPNQAPVTLKGALATEAEVGLKNGQSNLSSWNTAHGYTPDNPKYKTIMDYMTAAQQRKAIDMLGVDKIEEITGKPVEMRSFARPGAASAAQQPIRVNSPEEAMKLPSGTPFVTPDGRVKVRP